MPRWTPETKQQQALRCLQNQPWKHSTGPKHKKSSRALNSFTERELAQLKLMTELGLEIREMAKFFRISQSDLRKWLQQPEVTQLYQQSKAIAELHSSLALFRLAVAGNLRAIIWWEKTRIKGQDQLASRQRNPIVIVSS